MEGQPHERSKVVRAIAVAVTLSFAVAFLPSLVPDLAASDPMDDSPQGLGLIVWLASVLAVLVLIGIIAGIGTAAIGATDDPRRRAGVVTLFATMVAAVALGVLAGELLFEEDRQAGLGSLLVVSVIATAFPVTLGTLLGYAIGTNRRLA